MGIFRHRPFAFALFCFIFSSVSVYALAVSGIILSWNELCTALLFAVLFLVSAAVVVLTVFAVRRPKQRIRCVCAILALLLFVLGLLRSGEYFFFRYGRVQSLVGETVSLTLEIKEREFSSAAYARYRITAESVSVDGEPLDVPDFDAALVLEMAGEYTVGDRLVISAVGCALSELYDQPAYAIAGGCLVGFTAAEDENGELSVRILPTDTEAETLSPFLRVYLWFQRLRDRLSFMLSEGIGGDVGAFASAVLLGDRTGLSECITRDFARSGISHLLALSGLHMGILIGGTAAILQKLRFPRRAVSLLMLLSIALFLMLTGFSMSACRAGLMLGFAAVLGFFSRKPDSVTSLFFAAALMILIFPAAVASVGLWMSVSSVLGLLLLSPKWDAFFKKRFPSVEGERLGARIRRAIARVLYGAVSCIGVSLIANFSILPILYLSGGEFSVFGVLTNLLTVFLMPCFLVLALGFLLCGRVILIGPFVLTGLRVIGGWILSVASLVSSIPNASIALTYPFAGVCVAVFLFPTLCLLLLSRDHFDRVRCFFTKRREKRVHDVKVREISARWFLLPPLAATVLFVLCLSVYFARFSAVPLPVTAVKVSGGEMLVLQDRTEAVVIDLSDGYYSGYREAYAAVRECGVTECRRFVLTHYSSRQVASVVRFCLEYPVETVLLPAPASEREREIMRTLMARLAENGLSYAHYEREAELPVSDTVTLSLSESVYLDRSTQPIFLLRLRSGEETLVYFSSAIEESALAGDAARAAQDADVLIYGADGPVRHAMFSLPEVLPARLILSYGADHLDLLHPDSLGILQNNEIPIWAHDAAVYRIYQGRAEQIRNGESYGTEK